MSILPELKDELLYEYQQEFYNERGTGGKYRLVLAGTKLFAKYLKDPSDTKEIVELLRKEGLCSDLEFTEDDFSIYLSTHDCAFQNICNRFLSTDRQPMCCPLTNVLMKAIELQTGLSPEMLPVEANGNICKVGLAKMGTADVVDEKGVF